MKANPPPLPFGDIASGVLEVIYESLAAIVETYSKYDREISNKGELAGIARRLLEGHWPKENRNPNNPHILEGTRSRSPDVLPRITRLCISAFLQAQESGKSARSDDSSTIYLPSPLNVLQNTLTLPTRLESAAYARALCRAYVFSRFKVHPMHSHLPGDWHLLDIAETQDAIESFRTYVLHRDNVPLSSRDVPRMFLGHFLAAGGMFYLRFGTHGKKKIDIHEARSSCLRFCRAKEFLNLDSELFTEYEFRLAHNLADLPDPQEILNELIGIPLPIKGASTVFFGGVRTASNRGLVVSVNGAPGTGKTSLALGIAASLAPFGTNCLYISLEEDVDALRNRAATVTPQYFRRMSFRGTDTESWFRPIAISSERELTLDRFRRDFLSQLRGQSDEERSISFTRRTVLPAIAPLLVVVDSIAPLVASQTNSYSDLCAFIRSCRDSGGIVLLLSSEDIPRGTKLEYLVDTSITLRYEGTNRANEKPTRLFQLLKTRTQLSRPGSHIFHLSGEDGLRISPQLPSQLDAKRIYRVPLPDLHCENHALSSDAQLLRRSPQVVTPYLRLYRRSRILLHGHGSAGKAAIALKILMAPFRRDQELWPSALYSDVSDDNRILVISFLYPEEYYKTRSSELQRLYRRIYHNYHVPDLKAVVLTPSYIGPEDLIVKILSELDRGILEGRPYQSVLLDGLHNVFLQFPSLQEAPMVWPALYNLLIRYELTVVTTFTTFSLIPAESGRKEDADVVLEGQLPFLHALVQATDFYLVVEPHRWRQHERRFHLVAKSAINQNLPKTALVWNSESLLFEEQEEIGQRQEGPSLLEWGTLHAPSLTE